MRVVVSGGRDFTDKDFVYGSLDHVHSKTPITSMVQGEADGVDRLCKQWAIERGIPTINCAADWDKHGKKAGILRNIEMVDLHNPELAIIFPGGKGTAHMTGVVRKKGLKRYIPPYKELWDHGAVFEDRFGSFLGKGHDAIVNTVNTMGVMGKGVALAVKNAYPDVYELYRECCIRKEIQIGKVTAIRAKDGTWVLNLPTKKHWKNPSNINWVRDGLIDLAHVIKKLEVKDIGLPFPGCGNGRLLRYDVRPLIYSSLCRLPRTKITLYQ